MVDVFISYSRTNKDKVARIARGVEEAGYDVWWDAELPPHQSYGDVITAKIQSAKAAIVVWSAEAAASEWVRAEADVARNQKKLVQTALGDITPPLPFNQIQYANLGDWNGEPDHPEWRKVKASLADLCGPPRPRAAPAEPSHAFPAGPPPEALDPAAKPAEPARTKPASAKPAPAKPILPGSAPAAAAPIAGAAGAAGAAAGETAPPPASKPAPLLGKASGDGAVRSGGVPVPVVIGGGVALLGLAAAAFWFSGNAGDSDKPGEDTVVVADDTQAQGLLDGQPPAPAEDGKPADAAPAPAASAEPPAQPAPAQREQYNRDVRLINQTGDTIMYLYWSDTSQQNWGADRLGSNVFPAGNSWDVTIDDGNGACEYDIMAVTTANRQIVHNAVNVCSVYEIYFN